MLRECEIAKKVTCSILSNNLSAVNGHYFPNAEVKHYYSCFMNRILGIWKDSTVPCIGGSTNEGR
jgi:hypothetical protein